MKPTKELTVYDYDRDIRESVSGLAVAAGTIIGVVLALLGVPAVSAVMIPSVCYSLLQVYRFRQRWKQRNKP